MRTLLLVAAAVLALSNPATGFDGDDGNDLNEKCDGYRSKTVSIEDAARWSWCHGYISGVFGANYERYSLARMDYHAGLDNKYKYWCVNYPDGVLYVQLTAIVVKYLADNPTRRSIDAHILVTEAFKAAWPCKEPGQ